MNQGMGPASRRGKGQKTGIVLTPFRKEPSFSKHSDFSPVRPTSHFLPPKLSDDKSVWFQAIKCVVMCHSSKKKLIRESESMRYGNKTERNLNAVYDKGFRTEIVAGVAFYDVPIRGAQEGMNLCLKLSRNEHHGFRSHVNELLVTVHQNRLGQPG